MKSKTRIPEDLKNFLMKDTPKSTNKKILAFDCMCADFFEQSNGPSHYQTLIEKQQTSISEGRYTYETILSGDSDIQNNPHDSLLSLSHHSRLALTYRILAEDLEEQGMDDEVVIAITSACLHLGASISSFFIETGTKLNTHSKNKAAAQEKSKKYKKTAEYFAHIIRENAPLNGWRTRENAANKLAAEIQIFEIENDSVTSKDPTSKLLRWMRENESVKAAINETLKKK